MVRSTNNRLLAALPARERHVFVDLLEPISYTIKQSLYKSDEPIPYVYFPLGGVFSIVSDANHGGIIEIATVGKEGFVGVPVLLGVDRTVGNGFCQIPGDALRLRAGRFRDHRLQRPGRKGSGSGGGRKVGSGAGRGEYEHCLTSEAPILDATADAAGAPFYRRAWFWGAVGAVVVAGVATALILHGRDSAGSNPVCAPEQVTCLYH